MLTLVKFTVTGNDEVPKNANIKVCRETLAATVVITLTPLSLQLYKQCFSTHLMHHEAFSSTCSQCDQSLFSQAGNTFQLGMPMSPTYHVPWFCEIHCD